MRINAMRDREKDIPGPRFARSIPAGLALVMAISAAPAPSAAETGPEPGAGVAISAAQKQGAARLRGAWWLSRGVRDFIWSDFDPNGVAILMVERRPGRAPWAILMNHPAPPKGFTQALAESPDGPAVYAGEVTLPADAATPYTLAGTPVALYILGETLPDGPLGAEASERVVSRIVHEMVHVHGARKGGVADPRAGSTPAFPASPESIALAIVENRILAEFLYADSGNRNVLENLARHFTAVRRARWTLMGAASDLERRIELYEGPAVFAEAQTLKWSTLKQIEPPPMQEADPAYHSFQFGLIWRLSLVVERLLADPVTPAHLLARATSSGGAIALMIDRLGADWRGRAFTPTTTLHEILAEKVPPDEAMQAELLSRAREAYGYAAALAVSRSR